MPNITLNTTLQPKRRVTTRIATWSATHPWRAIITWLVFVVLCVMVGGMVGNKSATATNYRVGEAGRAESIAACSPGG